jgi:hypothetical protein
MGQDADGWVICRESAVSAGGDHGTCFQLDAVVSSLAGHARAVVLGQEARPVELDALIVAGAADGSACRDHEDGPAARPGMRRRNVHLPNQNEVRLNPFQTGPLLLG